MNDALKYPSRDLTLQLNWPSDQVHLADEKRVVVELQDASGLAIASVSVRKDKLFQAVLEKLTCYPLMTPDGLVYVVSDQMAEPLPSVQTIALDQLIAESISADMLDDEPNAANMLSELRVRLLKSLELLEQAIVLLPKP
jgi:hypothetical protein